MTTLKPVFIYGSEMGALSHREIYWDLGARFIPSGLLFTTGVSLSDILSLSRIHALPLACGLTRNSYPSFGSLPKDTRNQLSLSCFQMIILIAGVCYGVYYDFKLSPRLANASVRSIKRLWEAPSCH